MIFMGVVPVDRLDTNTKGEIGNQFAKGYDFFRAHAQQQHLGYPRLMIYQKTPDSPLYFENPCGVTTTISIENGQAVANMYCSPQTLSEHLDLHEGSETAYALTRALRNLPYSREAGEFAGNLALAEITRQMPTHGRITIRGKEYAITTTPSLYAALEQTLPTDAIRSKAAEMGLTESQLFEMLVESGRKEIGQLASLETYTRANDLILDFWLGREDTHLRDPFLRFLAEESYPTDAEIRELFSYFKR